MPRSACYFLLSVILLCVGCGNPNYKTDGLTIKGKIAGLPNAKIYVADVFQWERVMDSADIVNNEFTIHLKGDSTFEPFPMVLFYRDSSGKMRGLDYNLPSKNGKPNSHNSFFPGKTQVTITGDLAKREIYIDGGKDNDLFSSTNDARNVGYLHRSTGAQRARKVERVKKLVRQNPGSYVLVRGLFNNRYLNTNEELRSYLSLFNKEIRNSNNGRRLQQFISLRPEANAPVPNITLTNLYNEQQPIIDTTATLNLLVFWASWCGSCLEEVPYLKKVHEQFDGKGLHMAGISIDNDPAQWKGAVAKYDLKWPQFVTGASKQEELQILYNIYGIPVLLITERHGKVLARYDGFDEKQAAAVSKLIAEWLARAG